MLRRPRTWLTGALVLLGALAGLTLPASARAGRTPPGAARTVPQGFMGTVLTPPLFPDLRATPALRAQLDLMVKSGVESVRMVFDWAATQPYRTWAQVPGTLRWRFAADGLDAVPTDFSALDVLVAAAARRHLGILPTILGAPGWDARPFPGGVIVAPRDDRPYATFCRALVHRYGPGGFFWRHWRHPAPIARWQVWNEPNVASFWPQAHAAADYVRLLRAAHAAIRRADAHAQIVLAGLANYSWRALRRIYAIPGARGLFDIVGLHPYTRRPQDVLTILGYARRIMRAYGDAAKPIMADEVSWPSSAGHTGHTNGYQFATTESGQAAAIMRALPLLAAARARLRLIGVYWYAWSTVEQPGGSAFSYSGLLRDAGGVFVAKPALAAFRAAALRLEDCHVKGAVATVCRR